MPIKWPHFVEKFNEKGFKLAQIPISKNERPVLLKYVDEITEILTELLAKVAPMLREEIRQGNKILLTDLQKKGMSLYIPTMAKREAWKQKTRPVWDNLVVKSIHEKYTT